LRRASTRQKTPTQPTTTPLNHQNNLPTPPPKVKYSQLQAGLRDLNVSLNRKMLAELAASEPFSFRALVQQVAFMRGGGSGGASSSSGGGASSGGGGSIA
jgi:uncharacterized membrane protein YgcG